MTPDQDRGQLRVFRLECRQNVDVLLKRYLVPFRITQDLADKLAHCQDNPRGKDSQWAVGAVFDRDRVKVAIKPGKPLEIPLLQSLQGLF